MSENKYGEPWRFIHGRDITDEGYSYICDASGFIFNDAHDERIIACVNACAGMSDPAAEIAALRKVAEAAERYADLVNSKRLDEPRGFVQAIGKVQAAILSAVAAYRGGKT